MAGGILVVDDAEFFREQITRLLRRKGYHVAGEATTGEEALALYPALKPDLVLLDLALPGIDGFLVLRALHQLDKQVRVIVVSALCSKETVLQALEAGAADMVAKPLQEGRLLHAIDGLMGED